MSKSVRSPKMTEVLKCILVLNVISRVTSFDTASRRIQNQQSALYRYKVQYPEAFSNIRRHLPQRALRLTPSLTLTRDPFHAPNYRRKSRFYVKNVRPVAKPVPVRYRSRPPPIKPREERPVKTVLSNEIDESSEELFEAPDREPVPFDNEERFPSFGKGNIQRPNTYKKPEFLVAPDHAAESGESFTPIQTYYQVRQTNQVKHVPQSEALKDAATLEEVLNAPRLKELLRTTRVRETYSEEGYEDTGYDHGGRIRHAEHDETYKAQDEGTFRIQENMKEEDYAMPEPKEDGETARVIPVEEEPQESKIDPRIVRSRSEISRTSIAYSTLPSKYKGEHKYSSKIRTIKPGEGGKSKGFDIVTTEMYPARFWTLPTVSESSSVPTSSRNMNLFSFGSGGNVAKTESVNAKDDAVEKTSPRPKYTTNATFSEAPTRHFPIYRHTNSSSNLIENGMKKSKLKGKALKYNRLRSKFRKEDGFRLNKLNYLTTASESEGTRAKPGIDPDGDNRIILPTIGYINSLTTAHFGKEKSTQASNNNVLTTALNLTEALKYLRLNKQKNIKDSIAIGTSHKKDSQESIDLDEYKLPFEPMKLKKGTRNRRELGESEENADNDEADNGEEKILDEKTKETVKNEKLEDERKERKSYEKRLGHDIKNREKEILKEALWGNGTQNETEMILQEKSSEATTTAFNHEIMPDTVEETIDIVKYPFYFAEDIHEGSPLRYATNPKSFPKKTGAGMEFYKSRDDLVKCPDIAPELKDIPRRNGTSEPESQHGRITGLGDKIACLRKKYFDEDPFDNPIFKETEINYVGKVKNKSVAGGRTLSEDATEKGKRRAYSVVENVSEEQLDGKAMKTQEIKNVSHHVSNHHRPNRTLQIMAKNLIKGPQAWNERVIPVTELVDEAPMTHHVSWGLPLPPLRRGDFHSSHRPSVTSTVPPPRDHLAHNKIIIPHNCMYVISRVAAQNGHKNLMIDCKDAILVQEIRNGTRHVKIMPKIHDDAMQRKSFYKRRNAEQSDWIPMVGYAFVPGKSKSPGRRRGKADVVRKDERNWKGIDFGASFRKSKSESKSNKSDKPKRQKRAAVTNYLERTLNRGKETRNPQTPLKSGLREILNHLRGDRHNVRLEPRPFQKSEEVEPAAMGSQYLQGNNGQEMVYIRIDSSEVGHWVVERAEEDVAKGAAEKPRRRRN